MFACLASVLLACIIGALAAQNPAKPGPAEQKGIDSQPVFPKHYYKWSLDDITQNPEARRCAVQNTALSVQIKTTLSLLPHPQFRLPLTAEVQNAIYIQQSTRCERFVSVHNWPYGLGSALHVLTASLADSYNSDQVMVWGKYLEHFAGGDFATEFCEPGTRGTPRCVFEELTDCGNVPAVPVVKNAKNISSHWAELTQYQIIGSQVPRLGERAASPNGYFANKLRHEFGYNTMWDLVHWWRAQGVLWLTRPNEKFAALLRARRAALAAEMASGVPLPLPAGTISMHVRRADKVGEADSVPLGRCGLSATGHRTLPAHSLPLPPRRACEALS